MTVFSVDASHDDVELLLHALGDALRRWEGGDVSALSLSEGRGVDTALLQRARQLRIQAKVERGAIVHSTRPRIGPLIIRFQHLVRRLTWWFTEPILQQISAYQFNSALVIEGLAESLEAVKRDLSELQQRGDAQQLDELESRVQEIEAQLKACADSPDA
jgi:hypothetical protein